MMDENSPSSPKPILEVRKRGRPKKKLMLNNKEKIEKKKKKINEIENKTLDQELILYLKCSSEEEASCTDNNFFTINETDTIDEENKLQCESELSPRFNRYSIDHLYSELKKKEEIIVFLKSQF